MIEHRDGHNGDTAVVMTECEYCGQALPDGVGFSEHWPHCEVNPENTNATDFDTQITHLECMAMRMLFKDGWSKGELSMVFEIVESTVDDHVQARCHHG